MPGAYRIVLAVDGREFAQNIRIEPDPVISEVVTAFQDVSVADDDEEEKEEGELELEQERERLILERLEKIL